jgi:hypothetical protein
MSLDPLSALSPTTVAPDDSQHPEDPTALEAMAREMKYRPCKSIAERFPHIAPGLLLQNRVWEWYAVPACWIDILDAYV